MASKEFLRFWSSVKRPLHRLLETAINSVATKYFPSLNLEVPMQLAIRRGRLSVEILERPSDNAMKYDLFQRLNAGGIPAKPTRVAELHNHHG